MNEKQRRSGGPACRRRSLDELVDAIVKAATEVFAVGENRYCLSP